MSDNINLILEYILSLSEKENEFCVNQEILFNFGIIKKNTHSSDIETILSKQLSLVENKDYKIIQDIEINRTYKYIKINNNYMLTPFALKSVVYEILL
jgi:hypothetical protein